MFLTESKTLFWGAYTYSHCYCWSAPNNVRRNRMYTVSDTHCQVYSIQAIEWHWNVTSIYKSLLVQARLYTAICIVENYFLHNFTLYFIVYYESHRSLSTQKHNYTMISNCVKASITSLVAVSMTFFLQYSRSISMETGWQHIYISSYYSIVCKTQQNFGMFVEWFLMIEAVLDLYTITKQLLSIRCYLPIHLLHYFLAIDRADYRQIFFYYRSILCKNYLNFTGTALLLLLLLLL